MISRLRGATFAWVLVHVAYPLLPVLVEGCIRLVASNFVIELGTFKASTLAMSIGLLSVFVGQSLLTSEHLLADDEERASLRGSATLFWMFAIVSFCLFAMIVLLQGMAEYGRGGDSEQLSTIFEFCAFIGWVVPVVFAIRTQKSFKLRASF